MKTRTITFYKVYNCGAYLQAFALQKYLLSVGISNELLNYAPAEQIATTHLFQKKLTPKNIIKNAMTLLHFFELKKRKEHFEQAIQLLNQTERIITVDDFISATADADYVITGSDQVWNTNYNYPDDLFFIPDQYTGKRISYAPSFGQQVETLNKEKIIKYVSKFDSVSVREYSGKQFLSNLIENNVEQVCDPTFLLKSEDYDELIKKTNARINNSNYIFLYTINYSNGIVSFATNVAKQMGIPCVAIYTSAQSFSLSRNGVKVDYSAGPFEFLNYIKNAKLIITDSFHATAFSIIFKKKFWKYAEIQNGKIKEDNRTDDILNALGLNSRIVNSIQTDNISEQIDYNYVFSQLERHTEKSKNWLKNAITK